MPKIPTFTSQTEMTTLSPSIKSNVQMDSGSNIYNATKSMQKFLVNEYVKEKKLEADNKATLALSDLYINQENGTKGFYTIQSETGANGNPTDAANFFDEHVNKLWSHAEANKIGDLDNFTKKALEKKFYATAGIFKVKALLDSRNTQFQITKKITDDFVMKDALALKLNGINYLEIYKNNVLTRIEQDTTLEDAGVKKEQAELYLKFGHNTLANFLASSQPEILKENIDKFDALNVDEKLKLISAADKTIKDQTFNTLTSAIDQVGIVDIPPAALSRITKEIITGNFNNNKSLQDLYNSLTDIEKQEFSTFVSKKARAKRNELLFEISSTDAAVKLENVKKFNEALESAGVNTGIDQKLIDKIFQDNSEEKDQLTNMNSKLTTNIEENIHVSSDNDKNVFISSLISSDEINTLTDKFTLPGETEAKSIVERYGNGISKDDLDYYAEILLQQNENPKQFEKTFVPFHSFLNEMSNLISTEVIKILDPKSYNNDLIRFRDDMYIKYNEGLKEGKTPLELLDYKNKNFIGNDFISYQTDKNKIFKNMMKENVGEKTVIPKLEGETPEQYLDRVKFPGKKTLREDIESVAKQTTQKEFDEGPEKTFPDYDENFPSLEQGITYKGKYYEFDSEGNPPKRFLERLKKDRENNEVGDQSALPGTVNEYGYEFTAGNQVIVKKVNTAEMNLTSSKRIILDKVGGDIYSEKSQNNLQKFIAAVYDVESNSGDKDFLLNESSATGFFQFKTKDNLDKNGKVKLDKNGTPLKSSFETALSRLETQYKRANITIPNWVKKAKETKNPTKFILEELTYDQQEELFLMNIYGQKRSDALIKAMLNGDMKKAMQLYAKFHHTKLNVVNDKEIIKKFKKAYND